MFIVPKAMEAYKIFLEDADLPSEIVKARDYIGVGEYTRDEFNFMVFLGSFMELQKLRKLPAPSIIMGTVGGIAGTALALELTQMGYIDSAGNFTALAEEYNLWCLVRQKKKVY